jgi:hypothetical protein
MKFNMYLSSSCSTIGKCIVHGCNSYISFSKSFLIGFSGKCIS